MAPVQNGVSVGDHRDPAAGLRALPLRGRRTATTCQLADTPVAYE